MHRGPGNRLKFSVQWQISNSHHRQDEKQHSLFMNMPAKHEGSKGTEDYSAHKTSWSSWVPPHLTQCRLKHKSMLWCASAFAPVCERGSGARRIWSYLYTYFWSFVHTSCCSCLLCLRSSRASSLWPTNSKLATRGHFWLMQQCCKPCNERKHRQQDSGTIFFNHTTMNTLINASHTLINMASNVASSVTRGDTDNRTEGLYSCTIPQSTHVPTAGLSDSVTVPHRCSKSKLWNTQVVGSPPP